MIESIFRHINNFLSKSYDGEQLATIKIVVETGNQAYEHSTLAYASEAQPLVQKLLVKN